MTKVIERNARRLNKLKQERINNASKITQTTKNRLNQRVTLYKDRKIANVATVENFIKNLTSANKRTHAVTLALAVSLELCFRLLCEGVQGSETK